MKTKKSKIKIIVFGFLLFLFLYPQLSLAANLNDWQDYLKKAQDPTGYGDIQDPSVLVGKIINGVLGLLGVVFLCFMVYGGYLWMTAGGKEDRVTKAKDILTNSTIGLAIVLAAYAFTYFVVSKLIAASSVIQ